MAKNKAELQSDANQYREAISAMRQAHKEGEFLKAIEIAIHSCEFVDGMMQFERRFKNVATKKCETIDYLVQFARLLLTAARTSPVSS